MTVKPRAIIAIAFAALIVAGVSYRSLKNPDAKDAGGAKQNPESRAIDEEIAEDSADIFQGGNELFSYVWRYGPRKTMERLHALSATYGSCHDAAHRAGRYAYEIYDDESFRLCSAECHSGCYHGATEAYFKARGTADLSQNLKTLCNDELNAFFSHQCLHGIGHGLMAWTNYELFEALDACNLLPAGRDSCWTGVFMENIVGTLGREEGHAAKYLSEDPQYPCNVVDDQYKSSCYFLQTSRMMTLFQGDFKKIAAACSQAPSAFQRSCFESMGRDAGGTNRNDPPAAIAACSHAPGGSARVGCLIGAAQDTFWDPSGQDAALRFCALLTATEEKDACYRTIFERAPQVLASRADIETFCAKAEDAYQLSCRGRIR